MQWIDSTCVGTQPGPFAVAAEWDERNRYFRVKKLGSSAFSGVDFTLTL